MGRIDRPGWRRRRYLSISPACTTSTALLEPESRPMSERSQFAPLPIFPDNRRQTATLHRTLHGVSSRPILLGLPQMVVRKVLYSGPIGLPRWPVLQGTRRSLLPVRGSRCRPVRRPGGSQYYSGRRRGGGSGTGDHGKVTVSLMYEIDHAKIFTQQPSRLPASLSSCSGRPNCMQWFNISPCMLLASGSHPRCYLSHRIVIFGACGLLCVC